MWHSPVNDHRGFDATIDCPKASLDFGDHATVDYAVCDQLPCPRRGELRDQLLVGVEHPRNICQQ